MYLILFSSFANSSTDITHLNQNARPGVTAYVGIDYKRMKYVNCVWWFIRVFLHVGSGCQSNIKAESLSGFVQSTCPYNYQSQNSVQC